MPKVGVGNEPLLERLVFGYDGSNYRVVKVDTSGNLVAALLAGSSIEVTQDTAADLKATVNLATDQNVQARLHAYINSAWQKAPFCFGVSSIKTENVLNTSLLAGTNTLSTTAVTAGQIQVVTNIAFYYSGTVATVVMGVYMKHDAVTYALYGQAPPVSNQIYDRQGQWVMDAGDQMQLIIFNATAGDDANLVITGYNMDVAL